MLTRLVTTAVAGNCRSSRRARKRASRSPVRMGLTAILAYSIPSAYRAAYASLKATRRIADKSTDRIVTPLLLVVAAVYGLVIGSFLNVVIYRVPAKQSITSPPSTCPGCGNRIAARDNIPVLSWVLLRGRC